MQAAPARAHEREAVRAPIPLPRGWVASSDTEAFARLVECSGHVIIPTGANILAVMQDGVMHRTARPLPYSLAALRACAAVDADVVEVELPVLVGDRFCPVTMTLAVRDLLGDFSPRG